MIPKFWTEWTTEELDTELKKARDQGDSPNGGYNADKLIEELFENPGWKYGQTVGRLGYNHFLTVADRLMESPELALIKGSEIRKEIEKMPKSIVAYFDPMPAPEWVDESKLAVASEVWSRNIIPMLLVLFSSSLPACYLLKRGITALYDTEKLAEAKYVSQRLYETALMLDDVMDIGGIRVIQDVIPSRSELLHKALINLDPGGAWRMVGHSFSRSDSKAGDSEREKNFDQQKEEEKIQAEIQSIKSELQSNRYLWGRGYLSAKKVRALHASMRFMLINPKGFQNFSVSQPGEKREPQTFFEAIGRRSEQWNQAELGLPVNQEDMAFTLLTFGYLMPRGIAHWGVPLSIEQKEAFLHLWKVVGYVMGVRTDLTTDSWSEAEKLYARILERENGSSPAGIALTKTIIDFVGDLLPTVGGINETLPASMIIDQCGLDQAKLILPPEVVTESLGYRAQLHFGLVESLMRLRFWMRCNIIDRFPAFSKFMSGLIHRSGEELFQSFRDSYVREPFFIPRDSTKWIRTPGVTPEFLKKLSAWRQRLFNWLMGAIGCLILTAVQVLLTACACAFGQWQVALWLGGGIVVSTVLAVGIMKWKLPRVFAERPKQGKTPSQICP